MADEILRDLLSTLKSVQNTIDSLVNRGYTLSTLEVKSNTLVLASKDFVQKSRNYNKSWLTKFIERLYCMILSTGYFFIKKLCVVCEEEEQ